MDPTTEDPLTPHQGATTICLEELESFLSFTNLRPSHQADLFIYLPHCLARRTHVAISQST